MASLNKNRVKLILAERLTEKGFYDTLEKSGQKLKNFRDLKSFHKLVTMVGLGHFEKKIYVRILKIEQFSRNEIIP